MIQSSGDHHRSLWAIRIVCFGTKRSPQSKRNPDLGHSAFLFRSLQTCLLEKLHLKKDDKNPRMFTRKFEEVIIKKQPKGGQNQAPRRWRTCGWPSQLKHPEQATGATGGWRSRKSVVEIAESHQSYSWGEFLWNRWLINVDYDLSLAIHMYLSLTYCKAIDEYWRVRI